VNQVTHWIDIPESGAELARRDLRVAGWVHSDVDPVARVEIYLNDQLIGRAGLGRPRPDVALFLAAPDAELSGFELRVATPPLPADGITTLRVVATTLGGARETLETKSLRFRPLDEPRPAAPPDLPGTTIFRRLSNQWTRRRQPADPIRILWDNRSLDEGGSQLRMAELVAHLHHGGGFHSTVLSPLEGPLRASLEAVAADVHIGGEIPLDDIEGYERAQSRLAAWMKGRFDLVVGFTVSSFPVGEAARRLGVPYVLRIGEAEPLPTVLGWLGGTIVPEVEDRARQAFAGAQVLLCNSQAAMETYRADGYDGQFVVVRAGVDVKGARDCLEAADRSEIRRRLGIRPDERLLFCGASIWPIKGQSLLVGALEQLHHQHPDLSCVLVGYDHGPYADAIRSFVDRHGLTDVVRILPFQADLSEWWIAADLVVCPSESESLPTAALEAMAYGLPVLSCRVGDMPLVIEDGISGWLVDHSDLGALVSGLERVATTTPEQLSLMGAAAALEAARRFDRTAVFPRITDLFRATARGGT